MFPLYKVEEIVSSSSSSSNRDTCNILNQKTSDCPSKVSIINCLYHHEKDNQAFFLALLSNSHLLGVLLKDGVATQTRWIPWFTQKALQIEAYTLSPTGHWALCVVRGGGLFVVPIYWQLLPSSSSATSTSHINFWPHDDITLISMETSEALRLPSAVNWINIQKKQIALVAISMAKLFLLDLVGREELMVVTFGTDIDSLLTPPSPLLPSSRRGRGYTLCHTTSGEWWRLDHDDPIIISAIKFIHQVADRSRFNNITKHFKNDDSDGKLKQVQLGRLKFLDQHHLSLGHHKYPQVGELVIMARQSGQENRTIRIYSLNQMLSEEDFPLYEYLLPLNCQIPVHTTAERSLFTCTLINQLLVCERQEVDRTYVLVYAARELEKGRSRVRSQRGQSKIQAMGIMEHIFEHKTEHPEKRNNYEPVVGNRARGFSSESFDSGSGSFSAASPLQIICIPTLGERIVMIHPITLDKECELSRSTEAANSETSSAEKSGDSLLSSYKSSTNLVSMVVVSSNAAFIMSQNIAPEAIFFSLATNDGKGESKLLKIFLKPNVTPLNLEEAEKFGLALNLDITKMLHHLAIFLIKDLQSWLSRNTNIANKERAIEQIVRLYNLAKTSITDQIKTFCHYHLLSEVFDYFRREFRIKENIEPTESKPLADLMVSAYLQQIVKEPSKSKQNVLLSELTDILRDNFDYNEICALEKLLFHHQLDLFIRVSRDRNLVNEAFSMLSNSSEMISNHRFGKIIEEHGLTQRFVQFNDRQFLASLNLYQVMNLMKNRPDLIYANIDIIKTLVTIHESYEDLFILACCTDPTSVALQKTLSQLTVEQLQNNDVTSIFNSSTSSLATLYEKKPDANNPLTMLINVFLECLLMMRYKRKHECVKFQKMYCIEEHILAKILSQSKSSINDSKGLDLDDNTNIFNGFRKVKSTILSGGQDHAALVQKGDLYIWGSSKYGKLGMGELFMEDSVQRPIRVETLRMFDVKVKAVSCGNHHTVIATEDGTVFAWGRNQRGELGLGNETELATRPEKLEKYLVPSLNSCHDWSIGDVLLEEYDVVDNPDPVVQVACGSFHTLILTNTGCVFACGWGALGQLGLGSYTNRFYPTLIESLENSTIIDIRGGKVHSVALTDSNQIYAWGSNRYGQLGVPSFDVEKASRPVRVNIFEICLDLSSSSYSSNDEMNIENIIVPSDQPLEDSVNMHPSHLSSIDSDSYETDENYVGEVITCIASGQWEIAVGCASGRIYRWGADPMRLQARMTRLKKARKEGKLAESIEIYHNDQEVTNISCIKGEPVKEITSIGIGMSHIICTVKNGDVFGFGQNDHGQLAHLDLLGSNNTLNSLAIPEGMSAVTCLPETSVGLSFSGQPYLWGRCYPSVMETCSPHHPPDLLQNILSDFSQPTLIPGIPKISFHKNLAPYTASTSLSPTRSFQQNSPQPAGKKLLGSTFKKLKTMMSPRDIARSKSDDGKNLNSSFSQRSLFFNDLELATRLSSIKDKGKWSYATSALIEALEIFKQYYNFDCMLKHVSGLKDWYICHIISQIQELHILSFSFFVKFMENEISENSSDPTYSIFENCFDALLAQLVKAMINIDQSKTLNQNQKVQHQKAAVEYALQFFQAHPMSNTDYHSVENCFDEHFSLFNLPLLAVWFSSSVQNTNWLHQNLTPNFLFRLMSEVALSPQLLQKAVRLGVFPEAMVKAEGILDPSNFTLKFSKDECIRVASKITEQISSGEMQGSPKVIVMNWTADELASNKPVKAFTCGHHFDVDRFESVALSRLRTELNSSAGCLGTNEDCQTYSMLAKQYRRESGHLPCPDCVVQGLGDISNPNIISDSE